MLEGIRHLFKLDPAKELDDFVLERLLHSGTDGIVVGGTDGVTRENTERLIRRIRQKAPSGLPLYQEISTMEAVLPHMTAYLIPLVLNATNPYWLIGAHVEAVRRFGPFIPWEKVWVEGYLILHPEAKAFRLTEAVMPRDLEEAVAFAEVGGNLLRLPMLYIEYSGKLGDPSWVTAIRERIPHVHLIYGGGIRSRREAEMMGSIADTIVVGNILYEDWQAALATVLPKDVDEKGSR